LTLLQNGEAENEMSLYRSILYLIATNDLKNSLQFYNIYRELRFVVHLKIKLNVWVGKGCRCV